MPRELRIPITLDEFLVRYKWWNPDALVYCLDGAVNLTGKDVGVELDFHYHCIKHTENFNFKYWSIKVEDIK